MTEDEIAKLKAELDVANARSRLAIAMIARLLSELHIRDAPTVQALAKLCVPGSVWGTDPGMTVAIRELGLMKADNPVVEDPSRYSSIPRSRIPPPVKSRLDVHLKTHGSKPEE